MITDNPTLLRRGNLAPLLLVNLGVAVHATIWYMATTAMPSAVEELGAAAYLSWATSVYLVSSILGGAMMAPAKGRLGALKAMVIAGFVVMAGGVISAVAPSIFWVLAGRALQGLGEGFLVALSYALVRELFPNALVPRVFGSQAVSWGVAIVIGPLIGGWLTEIASWRGAFICSALLPIPMQVLGWAILRRQHYAQRSQAAPLLRLSLHPAALPWFDPGHGRLFRGHPRRGVDRACHRRWPTACALAEHRDPLRPADTGAGPGRPGVHAGGTTAGAGGLVDGAGGRGLRYLERVSQPARDGDADR